MSQIPTLIVCKNPFFAMGLVQVLEGSRFNAITEVSQFTDSPDAVILLEHNTAPVSELRQQFPQSKILLFVDTLDPMEAWDALQNGANGFCRTASDPRAMIATMELAAMGESIIPAKLLNDLTKAREAKQPVPLVAANSNFAHLSRREQEILRCIMDGDSNKHIARQYDLAEATVKVHVKAILRKLGARNRTQAAMMMIQSPPQAAE